MSQMDEARLGSNNINTKYLLIKRIDELEELFKILQRESEKARQEAATAKLSSDLHAQADIRYNSTSKLKDMWKGNGHQLTSKKLESCTLGFYNVS
ncbi:hypothetical protein BX666DRAFT_2031803 [Dichotomocladium elegans]|nr:hypothetical protein BX666DRAFT_2031803 [Dichotomocladium elegans]